MYSQGPHFGYAQDVTHAGFRPGEVGGCERVRNSRHFVPIEDLLGDRIAGIRLMHQFDVSRQVPDALPLTSRRRSAGL
jgi:hypothetical protein